MWFISSSRRRGSGGDKNLGPFRTNADDLDRNPDERLDSVEVGAGRIGKRIAIEMEEDLFCLWALCIMCCNCSHVRVYLNVYTWKLGYENL